MSKKLRILSPKVWLFGKIRLKISFRSKIEGKSDSQDFFFEIQSNRNTECITRIKPETRSTKPEMMGYEKPDPTRNPRKVYPLMPYYVTCKFWVLNFTDVSKMYLWKREMSFFSSQVFLASSLRALARRRSHSKFCVITVCVGWFWWVLGQESQIGRETPVPIPHKL